MKCKLKVLLCLVFVVLTIFTLISCNRNSPGENPSETTDSDNNVDDNLFTIVNNGELIIDGIIYEKPKDDDKEQYNAAKKLRETIDLYTDDLISLYAEEILGLEKTDSERYDIIFGQTGYPESNEVFSTLNYGDYCISIVGHKLIIASRVEGGYAKAVDYVIDNFLVASGENVSDKQTLKIGEYMETADRKVEKVLINDVPIEEYSLVYCAGKNVGYYKPDAEYIQRIISEKAGVLLPVISNDEECATKRKIYITSSEEDLSFELGITTDDPLHYVTKTVGNDYVIAGAGLFSSNLACQKFVEEYFSDDKEEKVVKIVDNSASLRHVEDCPLTENAEIRVMTHNIMAEWSTWGGDYMPIAKRWEIFKGVIDAYSPDVIGLQEVSDQWNALFLERMTDEYSFIYLRTPDDKFFNLSTIAYKKDKFNVIDKGLQYFSYDGPNKIRLVDWAIFEDKNTGKQFAFFNTHWMFLSGDDSQRKSHSEENVVIINKVLADHPNVKNVFSTADYNTDSKHEYTVNFLNGTGLVNSLDIAKKAGTLINEAGGCGSLGVSRINGTSDTSIDNIYVSPTLNVLCHETVLWNQVEHLSDHSPKYADVVLMK